MQRQEVVNVALIVFIALTIRLINFVGPVRGDDFFYLSIAHDINFGSLIEGAWAGSDRPGIFYPISIIYRFFGINPITSIAFTLFCSLATVVIIYFIGRLLKDRPTGTVVAMLWAVFPLDVINATQVYPDVIASAYVSASILLLLLGIRYFGLKRYMIWILMYFFIVVGYYTKEITLINAVFCSTVALVTILKDPASRMFVKLRASLGNLQLASLLILTLVILPFFVLNKSILFLSADPITMIGQHASDFYQAFFLGFPPFGYELKVPFRVDLFDIFILFFLIAFISQIARGEKKILFPAVWLGTYLLLFEWGVKGTRFPLNYVPPNPELVVDRRHILFLLIPLIIIIAMYLSEALEKNQEKKIYLLGFGLIIASYWINQSILLGESIQWEENIYAAAIIAILVSPMFLRKNKMGRSVKLSFVVFSLLLFGSLNPMFGYHSSDWRNERALIKNLQGAADFLLSTDPNVPIITIPSNTSNLNYASNFQLGWNWGGNTYVFPNTRIKTLFRHEWEELEMYIVFEDLDIEANSVFIADDWASVAEFEIKGLSKVIVFHHLP